MEFEWDPAKAAQNLRRHRVTFNEAATVFGDFLGTTATDPDHSMMERRYITVGTSSRGRLLIVSHAHSGVSAFESSRRERSPEEKEKPMNQGKSKVGGDLRPEYDLSELLKNGVRGKYAKRYHADSNIVLLEPEIRRAFRSEKAVNDALRLVIELRKTTAPRARVSTT
jgi:uncharacterized DUF497 family protein